MPVVRPALLSLVVPLAALASGPTSSGTLTAVFAAAQHEEDGARAAAFEARLEQALRAQGLTLVDLDAAFPRNPTPAHATSRADALFAQGQKAYDQLDGEKAAKRFEEALELYAARAGDVPTQRLVRSLVFLGAARRLAGDEPGARAAFVGALQLDPGFTPTSKLIDREVIAALEDVRGGISSGRVATVEVESTPSGATVHSGEQSLGTTPLATKLPAGLHVLTFRRGGWEPSGALARAVPEEEVLVRASLDPVPGYSAIREIGERLARPAAFKQQQLPLEARAVADRMGARYLVLASVAGGSAELQAWDVVTGNRLKGLSSSASADAHGLAPTAARIREFEGRPPPLGASAVQSEPPLVNRWWFWAAVGGVAVGVTAGILVATQPNRTNGPIASSPP